jgi:hypothetical protein
MTYYALNKEEKGNLELRSPDCPGRVRNVREIRKLQENLRTLRAFSIPVKKTDFTQFFNLA